MKHYWLPFACCLLSALFGLTVGCVAFDLYLDDVVKRETIYRGGHIYHVIDMGELK